MASSRYCSLLKMVINTPGFFLVHSFSVLFMVQTQYCLFLRLFRHRNNSAIRRSTQAALMSAGVRSWNWFGQVNTSRTKNNNNKPHEEEEQEEPDVHLCSQADKTLLAVVNDTWGH